ncbi:hypothetical protein JCM24511_09666 [Saitozyma sp. JCM 24511]|nr:hypothetical protein JCM24511_09666 [Saitozyma sp. JCM 24511]
MSASANPFEPQPLDANPFEPSTSSNPFSHPNDSAFSLESADTERASPASKGFGLGTGGYGGAAPSGPNRGGAPGTSDFEERERRLREREEAVRAREHAVGMKENNWPPFFPFIHHAPDELPEQHRTVGKLLYAQWLALAATLIINLLGCIFLLIAGSSEGGADTAAAGGYLPVIGVLSFLLWYRPIYLGLDRTEGKAMAFFFYIYFVFAGFNLLFAIYMAIGIPSTGSAGLINTISMFSKSHILAGVFGALSSVGWILQAAGGGILYKRIWDFKNGNGDITFQAASDQFKRSTLTNIILHQSRV